MRDLRDAVALFGACDADLADDVRHALDGVNVISILPPAESTRALPVSTRSMLSVIRSLISRAA
ncbi:MAG: hypothetical protein ABIP59_22540 [Roseateles sp.]